nr:hypothetical protein [Candidatus Sigynarchaeota archaeon]
MQAFQLDPGCPVEASRDTLLDVFKAWLADSARKNRAIPWKGVHDEGTYLTSWREYYMHIRDPAVVDYARDMLGKADAWMKANLVDGYRPKAEVHHGVEHYIIFLAWIHELDPDEPVHARQLRDAAANILSDVPGRASWYDPATIRFTSTHLGSRVVNVDNGVNIAEHLRIIRLAWLGLASGGNPELAAVIKHYATKWATQITESNTIPVYLDEFSEKDPERRERNAALFDRVAESFVGAQPKEITRSTRSEIHVANGTPDLFLTLNEITGKRIFLDAAERIVEPILDELRVPHAHPIGELAWRLYKARRLPGIADIAGQIRDQVDAIDGTAPITLQFKAATRQYRKKYANTIGMRKDMPLVEIKARGTRKTIEVPSPATFCLLYRLFHEKKHLQMSLEFARAVLLEARSCYPEGRDHGCSSRMVHSFCIGHGRNWGAGYTSTALRAALDDTTYGIELPRIKI